MPAINQNKAYVVEESDTCSPNFIIIQHPMHGRMYITEGYSRSLGYYTWLDGLAAYVKPTDTLKSLRETEWNDYTNHIDAVLHARDEDRPLVQWENYMIEEMAIAAIKNTK